MWLAWTLNIGFVTYLPAVLLVEQGREFHEDSSSFGCTMQRYFKSHFAKLYFTFMLTLWFPLTVCILMNTSIWFGSLYISRSQRLKFPDQGVLQSMNVVFISANSADPDEMLHFTAFHLGLHCLPKYLFRGFAYIKG